MKARQSGKRPFSVLTAAPRPISLFAALHTVCLLVEAAIGLDAPNHSEPTERPRLGSLATWCVCCNRAPPSTNCTEKSRCTEGPPGRSASICRLSVFIEHVRRRVKLHTDRPDGVGEDQVNRVGKARCGSVRVRVGDPRKLCFRNYVSYET